MINENSGASENDHFHRYNSKLLAIYDLFLGLKYPSLDWEHGLCMYITHLKNFRAYIFYGNC